MEDKNINSINLDSFANGELNEKFNEAYKKVIENINDPKTPGLEKRKISISCIFEPDLERRVIEVSIKVETKLAAEKISNTKILIDSDEGGEIIASEFKKQIDGQTHFEIKEDEDKKINVVSSKKEKSNLKN